MVEIEIVEELSVDLGPAIQTMQWPDEKEVPEGESQDGNIGKKGAKKKRLHAHRPPPAQEMPEESGQKEMCRGPH